jgi:hypothetical protein
MIPGSQAASIVELQLLPGNSSKRGWSLAHAVFAELVVDLIMPKSLADHEELLLCVGSRCAAMKITSD